MSDYTIVLTKKAEKALDKLSDYLAAPVIEAIGRLAHEPRPHGCKKLKGKEGYRVRVGGYRVIYTIADDILLITVITIAHRKEVYKKK